MDPVIGGALIGAGSGLLGDLFNFGQQRENLRYQKRLQREVFEREDTAVQRRVADLRAAGLSPTLAAGSAAASGATISTTAPQVPKAGERAREAIMGALEMRAMKATVRKIEAEAGRTVADTVRVQAESELAKARAGWAGDLASHEVYTREHERYAAASRADEAFQASQLRKLQVQLVRDYGIPEARADALIREIEARVAGVAEKMGAAPAKGLSQWLPLLQAVLDALR